MGLDLFIHLLLAGKLSGWWPARLFTGFVFEQLLSGSEPKNMKPIISNIVPVLIVGSYEETVSHYVEWLGFKVDWECREEQFPFVISVTRNGFSFMLSESEISAGSWTTIYVSDVEAMSEELNSRKSNSVKIELYPPNDIAQIHVIDPWKNLLVFEQSPNQ